MSKQALYVVSVQIDAMDELGTGRKICMSHHPVLATSPEDASRRAAAYYGDGPETPVYHVLDEQYTQSPVEHSDDSGHAIWDKGRRLRVTSVRVVKSTPEEVTWFGDVTGERLIINHGYPAQRGMPAVTG